jgi:uncharacterized protein DUF5666
VIETEEGKEVMSLYRRAVAPAVALGFALLSLACGSSSPTGVDSATDTRGAAIQGKSPSPSPSPSATPRPSPTPSPDPTPSPTPRPSPTPSPEDETEFRGRIEKISGSDLSVSGRLVHTNSSTRIRRKGDPIPFGALAVGQTVEVEGAGQADGSLLASKITLEDDDDNPGVGAEVEFQGTIQAINNTTLTVAGRLVRTDASTRIRRKGDDLPFSALAVGQRVEVEGNQQSDGSVLAKKIGLED